MVDNLSNFLWLYFFNWHLTFNSFFIFRYLNEFSFSFFIFCYFYVKRNFSVSSFILFLLINLLYSVYSLTFNLVTTISTGYLLLDSLYIRVNKICVLILGLALVFVISTKLRKDKSMVSDFLFLLNMLFFFLFVLLSCYDFLVLYLCIEGMSLVLYVLGGLVIGNLLSLEATIKYFLFNSLCSGIMLLGIGLIFGIFGSLSFLDIQFILTSNFTEILMYDVHILCFLSIFGLLFKLGVFPLNWWVADVYEGLWTPVTICFAVLVKVAIFLLFFRVIFNLFFSLNFVFQPFILISSLCSILIGCVGAFYQVRVKRFFAYASISQVGYIMLGIGCCSLYGFLSAIIHLFLYAVLSLSFFTVLLNNNNFLYNRNAIFFHEFKNFFRYNYRMSYLLCLVLMGMSAFPPAGTFFSKVLIYSSLFESKCEFIVFLVMFCNVISAYYYLKFMQDIFFFNLTKINVMYSFYSELNRFGYLFVESFLIIVILFIIIFPFYFDRLIFVLLSCMHPFLYC